MWPVSISYRGENIEDTRRKIFAYGFEAPTDVVGSCGEVSCSEKASSPFYTDLTPSIRVIITLNKAFSVDMALL